MEKLRSIYTRSILIAKKLDKKQNEVSVVILPLSQTSPCFYVPVVQVS